MKYLIACCSLLFIGCDKIVSQNFKPGDCLLDTVVSSPTPPESWDTVREWRSKQPEPSISLVLSVGDNTYRLCTYYHDRFLVVDQNRHDINLITQKVQCPKDMSAKKCNL